MAYSPSVFDRKKLALDSLRCWWRSKMTGQPEFVFLHPDQKALANKIEGFDVIIAYTFQGSLEDWNLSKSWNEPQNAPRDYFIQGFKSGYLAASK